MDKFLELKIDVGGGAESTPFPNENDPIIIGAFRYDAKRMGGAPTITASVNYPTCLDNEWTDNVYATFNGEKYYLKQTPTSSYNNESTMYKHDLELVSERVILDNVYFFDTVVGDPQGDDKPVSNSTKVVFFGNIHEFASRLNSSLEYSGLDYTVVVDDDKTITNEGKLMSFEDQFFSNVLQEIYNTYKAPYYFEGKTIHIGRSMPLQEGETIPVVAYGVDNALLSITKNNANYKIVNRATATGSSENIPFYYPNTSPKGIIDATSSNANLEVTVIDNELYSNAIELDGEVVRSNVDYENLVVSHLSESIYSGQTFSAQMGAGGISKDFFVSFDAKDVGELSVFFSSNVTKFTINGEEKDDYTVDVRYYLTLYNPQRKKVFTSGRLESVEGVLVPITEVGVGYRLNIETYYAVTGQYAGKGGSVSYNASFSFGSDSGWTYNGRPIELKDIGLKVEGNPVVGDTITQKLVKYVKTSQNLMPSIYRETDGAERFYNAINGEDGYQDESGNDIVFNNPYTEGKPKEHIFEVEDIKPTIKEATNGISWVETDEDGNQKTVFQRMDMFSEFAYDLDDNDETIENENGDRDFVHSYFFAKLRKLDFNLFDHAIENQPMVISFTSGDCGACNFEIGVTEEFPQKNPVQVNTDGTLKRDANGRVICGQFEDITEDECQPEQQDTINNEVWIALKKEETTYGILMPKAPTALEAGHRPKGSTWDEDRGVYLNDGDTFVILGINLPQSYIINAEKKLEAEIIKYLQDNNNEKFTFSIDFSRIYFEENEIHDQLSENSKIAVMYNGQRYELYVSSFSYSMSEGDVLPDIRVELDETLQVSQNALQNAISQVKSELGKVIGNIDVFGATSPFFLRKDTDDEAQGTINFKKGVKFGEGGKVEILDNNSAKLSIEYLEVTKKATFTSLEIQEKTHVGGQILVTPAAINCGEVEEFDDYYRCYFQTKGVEGDEIFNQFAVGDQAICQTYNAWGSKYYWRLVTGIGEDYIDLSKVEGEYDEDSDAPSEGDKIIQLGNQIDEARQNAIVIAAYGDNTPHIIQYKGINKFELADENVVTKFSPTENIITGVLHIQKGTTGVENLEGLPEFIHENVGEVETGESGSNLLRNSGFTGDYLSEELADEDVLIAESQMFSSPLDYWTANEVTVEANEESESGFGVVFASQGSLAQTLHYNLIANEGYVLSFRARSTTGAAIVYTIGDQTGEVVLTNESARYVVKVVVTSSSKAFSLTCDDCSLWEVQLERGTMASSWGRSFLDNSSDRVYWQAQKYISGAIEDASTTFAGGLGLTNMMMFGNYDKETKSMTEVTAGVSGNYEDDHDVAFWAGGDYNSAVKTVADYLINHDKGTWQPTDAELATMAKFVLTHGGTAILNDIILRGYVYAEGGEFKGEVKVDMPTKNGRVEINDDGFFYYGTNADGNPVARVMMGGTCVGASAVILAPNAGGICSDAALILVGDTSHSAASIVGDVHISTGVLGVPKIVSEEGTTIPLVISGDVSFEDGVIRGLCLMTRTVTSSDSIYEYDHTVIVKNSAAITLTLPESPREGQTYRLLHTTTNGVTIDWNGKSAVNIATGSAPNTTFSARRTVVLTYHDGTWYAEYIELAA